MFFLQHVIYDFVAPFIYTKWVLQSKSDKSVRIAAHVVEGVKRSLEFWWEGRGIS